MENETNDSMANLDERARRALEAGDAGQLADAFAETHPNETIEALGLRVQLRDFWQRRHADLAAIASTDHAAIDAELRGVFTSMDDELALLDQATAESRRDALTNELRTSGNTTLVSGLLRLNASTLGTPATLLGWTRDWRDGLVESLWAVVQDFRETGMTDAVRAEADQLIAEANGHVTKLAQGAVNPEAV